MYLDPSVLVSSPGTPSHQNLAKWPETNSAGDPTAQHPEVAIAKPSTDLLRTAANREHGMKSQVQGAWGTRAKCICLLGVSSSQCLLSNSHQRAAQLWEWATKRGTVSKDTSAAKLLTSTTVEKPSHLCIPVLFPPPCFEQSCLTKSSEV